MLKFVMIGLTVAALGGAGVYFHPRPTESFAFASVDGQSLLIYACAPRQTAAQTESNARAAHRFLQAEMEIAAEGPVAALLFEMRRDERSMFARFLGVEVDIDSVQRGFVRNLAATFGCRVIKAQAVVA